MLLRALRILLLGVALAPAALSCGTSKPISTDGSAKNDGSSDDQRALGCIVGALSDAGGVWCEGFVMPATLRDGQWSCPSGMVFDSDCTCGEPGLSCSPQICTAAGPVCLDAGTDSDADHAASTDGAYCGDGPNPSCGQVVGMSGINLVICSDYFKAATCVGGRWTCAAGEIEARLCTCSEFSPPGCNICTPQGWACPDGGVDAVAGDANAPDASCDVGCTPSTTSPFCQASEVQWMCQGASWNDALFRASCRDPATDLQRFCCPPSFLSQCH